MTATVIGNKEGVWINPVDNHAHVNPEKAKNYADVHMEGVNHICINVAENNSFRIIQASGYTHERGMFCDLY